MTLASEPAESTLVESAEKTQARTPRRWESSVWRSCSDLVLKMCSEESCVPAMMCAASASKAQHVHALPTKRFASSMPERMSQSFTDASSEPVMSRMPSDETATHETASRCPTSWWITAPESTDQNRVCRSSAPCPTNKPSKRLSDARVTVLVSGRRARASRERWARGGRAPRRCSGRRE
jgi:hypothetical protein